MMQSDLKKIKVYTFFNVNETHKEVAFFREIKFRFLVLTLKSAMHESIPCCIVTSTDILTMSC